MTIEECIASQGYEEPVKVEPPKLDRHPCPLCSHWLGNHKTADDFWICVDCKYRWKVEAARPDLAAIQARAEAWAGAEPVEDFEAARDRAALLDEVARLESALKGWIGDAERLQREVARLTRERDAGRQLLQRIVKYAKEDRARTPNFTRFARALDEARALLDESEVKP